MGEAKRRKQLDKGYGVNPNAKDPRFLPKVIQTPFGQKELLPDCGELHRLKRFPLIGDKITLIISSTQCLHGINGEYVARVVAHGLEGVSDFCNESRWVNIGVTMKIFGVGCFMTMLYPFSLFREKGIVPEVTLRLTPEDRYKTDLTKEWVTPYYVISEGGHPDSKNFIQIRSPAEDINGINNRLK